MKVIVISSMNQDGTIIARGERGPVVDGEFARVDGKGPYNVGFMVPDTEENVKAFDAFIQRSKERMKQQHTDMFQTLNHMRHGTEPYK